MRSNYPETARYLAARKARHPRDDALEDYTEWTMLGEPIGQPAREGLPGQPHAPAAKSAAPKEETREEYVNRRCDEYMHKTISSRRSVGGKFFTVGGGGDGGQHYQIL